ncbi:MAG: DUF4097 domain-containing protein [bacterium]|nr:DUF4097 domain-containing protein [bacterium]
MSYLRRSSETFRLAASRNCPLSRAIAAVSALIVVLLFTATNPLYAKDFSFDFQRVLDTGPEAELELNYISGDLRVISSDGERIVVEAVKRVNAAGMDEAELVADHIEIKIKHDKNKVSIATNYLRMRNRSASFWQKVLGVGGTDSFGEVDWTIRVPQGCRLTVINTSGKMDISHILGDLDIRTSSAEIDLNSIEGQVNIENASGATRGELLFGPVTLRQAQGKIDLRFVEGDIRIKSSSADVTVRQDRGSFDLTTATGNVTIETYLDSSRDYFVSTESGNITLSIPETSSGNLRIESQTGDIKTDIPIAINSMSHKQIDGTFGLGGVSVHLMSISGDVTVAQF